MVVSTSMLYITLWFLKSTISLLLKLLFIIYLVFLLTALFSWLRDLKAGILFFLCLPFIIIFLFSLPLSYFFGLSLPLFLILFLLDPTPLSSPQKKIWSFFNRNLKIIIKAREIIYIPDQLYFFISKLKSFFLFISSSVLIIIFFSYHQAFLFLSFIFFTLTASLIGYSLGSIFNLFFMAFSSPTSESPPLSNATSPSLLFSKLLKYKINNHPLNAVVEETFFEDNLQIGDFYLVYPIFYKSSLPPSIDLSLEKEISSLWHLIRWESALSKQTGSAASRWSSIFSLRSSPAKGNAYSIHTPLIPIYSEELYLNLISLGLPHFDPFNQAPNWSPYLTLVLFLGWNDDEIKEERLKEIEEEDWQCSLNRTSSLHLDRGIFSPEPSLVFGDSTNKGYSRWLFSKNLFILGLLPLLS